MAKLIVVSATCRCGVALGRVAGRIAVNNITDSLTNDAPIHNAQAVAALPT
jgi:hypothetical protein